MRNALLPQTTTLALSLGTILSGALLVEIVFGYAGMGARARLPRPRLIIADEPVSMVDASLRATILDTLRRLNQSFGISVIYITHDLTTAYQIADNIVVMYRGAAVEAGDVEHVVKNPLHPYSQLLVASIPLPDPAHAWQRDATPVDTTEPPVVGLNSCRFADRCRM